MSDSRIEIVDHDWPRFSEVVDVWYAVLYEPFGVAQECEWYHPANGSVFVVALGPDGGLLGAARLLPAGDDTASRQVRQVVVAPEARGLGVGRELMLRLESVARDEGARELWLNSRATAYGFYERLGFVGEGDEFVSELTGILHRTMRKQLG